MRNFHLAQAVEYFLGICGRTQVDTPRKLVIVGSQGGSRECQTEYRSTRQCRRKFLGVHLSGALCWE